MTSSHNITIVGLWHQGVVAAACFAELGYDVRAADADEERVAKLNDGEAPLFEPGLNELLRKGIDAGRLRFTADVAGAAKGRPYVLIMHDTPVDANDQSDLSGVLGDVQSLAPNLDEDAVILVTAQVPVGTCDQIEELIRNTNPDARFGIGYSPENLRLGQAIERFMKPALPILGSDDEKAFQGLEELLSVLPVTFERASLRTAEMSKHALNAFLATSVTFGNELGNLCDEVGADGRRVAELLRMEERVGDKTMLFPGLAFSGGTLARDMQTLRQLGNDKGLETPLLDGVWDANEHQNDLVMRKLQRALGTLTGQRIAVWGLTYKAGTSTLRRSAALSIIQNLVKEGAEVTAHDPKADREELAMERGFGFVEDRYEATEDTDALVIITGWPEYQDADFDRVWEVMRGKVLLDTNNMLDRAALEERGFVYLGVGRGT